MLVDDANLGEGNLRPSNDSLEDVADMIQQSIDQWERSLKTSSRAVRLDKSFVCLINFIFKALGEPVYECLESMDIELSVKDEFKIRENLELVEAYEGREILGVVMALSSDMSDEIHLLSGKISTWVNAMKQR